MSPADLVAVIAAAFTGVNTLLITFLHYRFEQQVRVLHVVRNEARIAANGVQHLADVVEHIPPSE